MRLLPSLATLCVLLALLAAPVQAQRGRCSKCKGAGTVACKGRFHNQKKICGVKFEHKCTALYNAKCCNGLGKVLCPSARCSEKPISEIEYQEAVDTRKAWVKRMRAVDKKASVRFEHVETDMWILHSSIPRWKVKDRSFNRIKTAHRFMGIYQRTAEMFKKVTGMLPRQKQTVFVVPDEPQQMAVTLHFMGSGQKNAFKIFGTACIVCTWPRPPELKDTDMFEAHLCHLGAHELIQSAYRYQQELPAWIDLGLAHWIELEVMDKRSTFCFREVAGNNRDRWRLGKWKKMLHAEVRKRDAETLANMASRDSDNMEHRDHAHAWSYVDFLIRAHPAEFKKLFKQIKVTNKTRKSLDDALGWSTQKFHEEWRRFVNKTYPPR